MRPERLMRLLVLLLMLVGCAAPLEAPAVARDRRLAQSGPDNWENYLPVVIRDIPPTATATPTATFTATPTNTATSTPTSTRTATSTATATRTSTPSSGCSLTHYGAFELELYDLINAERDKVGLAHLVPNYSLEVSAGAHSDDMAINNFLSHTGSDGSTFWQRAQAAGYTGHWGGEIIMMGVSTPEEAVTWWMGDQPHKDMILGDLNDFGAGYAHCYSAYYTVDFGHK